MLRGLNRLRNLVPSLRRVGIGAAAVVVAVALTSLFPKPRYGIRYFGSFSSSSVWVCLRGNAVAGGEPLLDMMVSSSASSEGQR